MSLLHADGARRLLDAVFGEPEQYGPEHWMANVGPLVADWLDATRKHDAVLDPADFVRDMLPASEGRHAASIVAPYLTTAVGTIHMQSRRGAGVPRVWDYDVNGTRTVLRCARCRQASAELATACSNPNCGLTFKRARRVAKASDVPHAEIAAVLSAAIAMPLVLQPQLAAANNLYRKGA